jgi:hypothetical protein
MLCQGCAVVGNGEQRLSDVLSSAYSVEPVALLTSVPGAVSYLVPLDARDVLIGHSQPGDREFTVADASGARRSLGTDQAFVIARC